MAWLCLITNVISTLIKDSTKIYPKILHRCIISSLWEEPTNKQYSLIVRCAIQSFHSTHQQLTNFIISLARFLDHSQSDGCDIGQDIRKQFSPGFFSICFHDKKMHLWNVNKLYMNEHYLLKKSKSWLCLSFQVFTFTLCLQPHCIVLLFQVGRVFSGWVCFLRFCSLCLYSVISKLNIYHLEAETMWSKKASTIRGGKQCWICLL
jgi:hypothetical protein